MTVTELADKLNLKIIAGKNGLSNVVKGGYCGDLLSWVMGRAKEGDAWLTVMGNINTIAVALLADVACIILSENAALDKEAKDRADAEAIPVLSSEKPIFQLAAELSEYL